MSTLEERRAVASAGVHDSPNGFGTRVVLQPIAAPSILGLAGFAGATFIVASNLAGWWDTPQSPLALAPFAAMFGGLAQFMAGMWAYRARDAVATLAHGTWGSFWLAYLILNILVGAHVVTQPTPWYHNPEVGFWFFALAITTGIAAVAALAESLGLVAVLSTLAAGSGIWRALSSTAPTDGPRWPAGSSSSPQASRGTPWPRWCWHMRSAARCCRR
jgi:succinate-acetate transporter protein